MPELSPAGRPPDRRLTVILKLEYWTEVYVSKSGYICIKQDKPAGSTEGVFMLSPSQAKAVAHFIRGSIKEAEDVFSEEESE